MQVWTRVRELKPQMLRGHYKKNVISGPSNPISKKYLWTKNTGLFFKIILHLELKFKNTQERHPTQKLTLSPLIPSLNPMDFVPLHPFSANIPQILVDPDAWRTYSMFYSQRFYLSDSLHYNISSLKARTISYSSLNPGQCLTNSKQYCMNEFLAQGWSDFVLHISSAINNTQLCWEWFRAGSEFIEKSVKIAWWGCGRMRARYFPTLSWISLNCLRN